MLLSGSAGGDLPHRAHGDGREHPGGLADLLQHVLHGQAVDDGGKHPHLVGAGALHVAAPVLGAAPEVAAADDQAHLDPLGHAGLDDLAHLPDEGKVDAPARLASQALSADIQ